MKLLQTAIAVNRKSLIKSSQIIFFGCMILSLSVYQCVGIHQVACADEYVYVKRSLNLMKLMKIRESDG